MSMLHNINYIFQIKICCRVNFINGLMNLTSKTISLFS